VLRDPRFSSNPTHVRDYEKVKDRLAFTDTEHVILTMDPPDHTRLRRLASRAFTPGTVAALEPWVRARTVELLDALEGESSLDVVGRFAEPLPISVIAHMLGVDHDPRFARWGREMLVGTMPSFLTGDEDRAHADEATQRVSALLTDAVEARHRSPRDDVLGELVRAEEDGDRLSAEELIVLAVTLLVAGFVTTVNLIANGIALLAERPDVVATVRRDRAQVATAVEEILRLDGGTVAITRFATVDVELAGATIERGDPVTALVASANRDPAQFVDPDRFDPSRENAARHLAFGSGIHLCLGAPLARLEARVAFDELLARYGSIEVVGRGARSDAGLRGYSALEVRLG
jgi:cytochrome P450